MMLLLNNGFVNDKQIIDKKYMDEMMTPSLHPRFDDGSYMARGVWIKDDGNYIAFSGLGGLHIIGVPTRKEIFISGRRSFSTSAFDAALSNTEQPIVESIIPTEFGPLFTLTGTPAMYTTSIKSFSSLFGFSTGPSLSGTFLHDTGSYLMQFFRDVLA